ncbi:hypothetical protein LMG27177_00024 [Paraburkholderia fynbosensis]|uniref:Uncharacterized protein n=1 Tax=Paraburkholderia fynbosensis TaxID=1200993 RepID=A0A6J5FE66_9BURK|nr:hypothetical protein LMG27177_00024 [Paraburkholderia fynbosensis]
MDERQGRAVMMDGLFEPREADCAAACAASGAVAAAQLIAPTLRAREVCA